MLRSFRLRHVFPAPALALALALGCGGAGENIDDAVVTTTEPAATTSTSTSPPPTPGATESASATPAADESSAAAPAAVQAAGWGTLKGKITFAGDPPSFPPLVKEGETSVKDGAFCAQAGVPNEKLVVDSASKGVRWVLVYIPKPTAVNPEATSAAQAANVEFDQKGCRFEPHVLAVMKGAKVAIQSSDQVGHNVNAAGLTSNRFNVSLQAGSQDPVIRDIKVAERRPGDIVCDIHPWMKAYWLVSDNPYFAVTDAEGNFEIKNVPAGTQNVVVWQEAANDRGFAISGNTGKPVNIQADGTTDFNVEIQPAQLKLN